MPTSNSQPAVIEPVIGEPTRFYVPASQGDPYLVDLEEFDGVGWCGCPDFDLRRRPKIEQAIEAGRKPPVLRCKHIEAVLKWRAR